MSFRTRISHFIDRHPYLVCNSALTISLFGMLASVVFWGVSSSGIGDALIAAGGALSLILYVPALFCALVLRDECESQQASADR